MGGFIIRQVQGFPHIQDGEEYVLFAPDYDPDTNPVIIIFVVITARRRAGPDAPPLPAPLPPRPYRSTRQVGGASNDGSLIIVVVMVVVIVAVVVPVPKVNLVWCTSDPESSLLSYFPLTPLLRQ